MLLRCLIYLLCHNSLIGCAGEPIVLTERKKERKDKEMNKRKGVSIVTICMPKKAKIIWNKVFE